MFPLRDSTPSGSFPIVTFILIIVNTLVFLYELSLGSYLEHFVTVYGLTPAHVTAFHHFPGGFSRNVMIPMFTSIFMHGGWMHLIGNMWFLWIFGDNIEDRLGHFKYLIFYLLCGIGATLIHVIFHPASNMPTIGASGAISGVLGAYLISYPHARVYTLLFIFVIVRFVELPAFLFLILWFGFQLVSGAAEFGAAAKDTAGVAYWAHMGGFVIGIALLFLFPKNPNVTNAAWYDGRYGRGEAR